MLNDDCRRFRARFEPGSSASHRDHCPECDHYATLLESSAAPARRRPMPSALRQRLREIPHREVTCRDVLRLYRSTLSRAAGTPGDEPAIDRHLARCDHCRELYDTLYHAFTAARRPLSQRLTRRLRDIARRPQRLLPVWIHDTRYAAAACYLIAALTLPLASNASAVFRDTTDTVSSKAHVWADESEARGLRAWNTMTSSIETHLESGWDSLERYGTSCKRWVADAVSAIESTTLELIPDRDRSVEGDKDD